MSTENRNGSGPGYPLSVLDISPVPSGSSSSDALRNTLDLATLTDQLGFSRYWLAEHHNTALIASTSPEVMIGHVANVTRRMRVGSGGIMLPNHAPLKVAETFRVLEALHPGRVDLGLGRAPGTDPLTALALRRSREAVYADDFPAQLAELLAFFDDDFPANHPYSKVKAMPEDAQTPEIWLLGSSDFSAQLAASAGLGFAFAHHIQPEPAIRALRFYRDNFKPSRHLAEPRSLIAVSAICAETEEQARELAGPVELMMLRFRQGGRMGKLPSVEEARAYPYSDEEKLAVREGRQRLTVGSPAVVRERLTTLAAQGAADEIMVTTITHSHADRRRSYELLAEAFGISAGESAVNAARARVAE
ncbi:MAG TPA: LLM class flavin-dependent oxidoreductase [Candidatus Acidoferrales bacterium]